MLVLTFAKLWLTRGQTVCVFANPTDPDPQYVHLAQLFAHAGTSEIFKSTEDGWHYSYWIATNHLLGLPLLLANQLLVAATAGLFVRALRPLPLGRLGSFAVYTLLLWYPMSFDASSMSRVTPAQIGGPIVVSVISAGAAIALRAGKPLWRQLPWSILLGISLALLGASAIHNLWVIPGLGLLAGGALYRSNRISVSMARIQAVSFSVAALMGLAFCHIFPGEMVPSNNRAESGFSLGKMILVGDFVISSRGFSSHSPASHSDTGTMQTFRDLTGEKLTPRTDDNPPTGPIQGMVDLRKVSMLQSIGKLMRPVLLVFFVTAQIAFFWRMMTRKKSDMLPPALLLAATIWLVICAGLLAVTLSGPTSIQTCAPLYPLVPLFVACVALAMPADSNPVAYGVDSPSHSSIP